MPIADDQMNRRQSVHDTRCSQSLCKAIGVGAVTAACFAASIGAVTFVAPNRRIFCEYIVIEHAVRACIASMAALGAIFAATHYFGAPTPIAAARRRDQHIVTLCALGGRAHVVSIGVERSTFGDAVERARSAYAERLDTWRACRSTTSVSDGVLERFVKRTQVDYLGEARTRGYTVACVLIVGAFDECLDVARHLDRIPAEHAIWYCYVAPYPTSDGLALEIMDNVRVIYGQHKTLLMREVVARASDDEGDEQGEASDEQGEASDEDDDEIEEKNAGDESDEEVSMSSAASDSPVFGKTGDEQ